MSRYDNVVIFGVEQMMEQLEEKLEQEMKEGGVVVACRCVLLPPPLHHLHLVPPPGISPASHHCSPGISPLTSPGCRFKFPTWTPVAEVGEGVDTVWRYER